MGFGFAFGWMSQKKDRKRGYEDGRRLPGLLEVSIHFGRFQEHGLLVCGFHSLSIHLVCGF